METVQDLHTAARRYCMEQYALWTGKYASFPSGGPYSDKAYDTFPRYRFADETLINIERLVFGDKVLLPEARDLLVSAGAEAFEELKKQFVQQAIAVAALKEEVNAYQGFIEGLTFSEKGIEPLPFRRVLPDEEVTALWHVLQDRWDIRGPGYGWFPLSEEPQPPGLLTFHTDLWDARRGDLLFKEFLAETSEARCFVLRELGPPDYEMDRELAEPTYDGSERFLFTNADWVVYASHESSLTLAGTICAFFQNRWNDADTFAYGGPFSTPDLRGRAWS